MAPVPLPYRGRKAYDPLRDDYAAYFFMAITVAALIHLAVLATARFDVLGGWEMRRADELAQVELREYQVPPPPEAVARPAIPVLSTRVDISEEITIGSVLLRDNPVHSLPAPSLGEPVDVSESPAFTPYEVRPQLRNAAEVQRALQQGYPAYFRDAGVGGRVILWVFINEAGEVRNTRVVEGCGYPELDGIAENVVRQVARFSPAYNRDQRVPVWIQIPVTFNIAA
jgi:TonB family protein